MRRRNTLIAVILLATSFNVLWFFYRRRHDVPQPVATEAQRQKDMASLISAWGADRHVPILSESLRQQIAALKDENCISVPKGARSVSRSDLSQHQTDDLSTAIADLLQAYARNSPEAVFDYMHTRGKALDKVRRKGFQELLTSIGQHDGADQPDRAFYSETWKTLQRESHWKVLVPESSCVQIWEVTATASELENMASKRTDDLFGTFHSVAHFPHNFVSTAGEPYSDERHGSVILADAKLVIQYDKELFGDYVVCFLQLMYNHEIEAWQPWQLSRIRTARGRKQAPLVLF